MYPTHAERSASRLLSLALRFVLSLSFSVYPSRSVRPSVSLRSDINCLLPNLIRNFRRRGNLTSFLFSLARSRVSCGGSRSQDFSIHDRRAGSNQTTGHPRSNLINLYRCVTYAFLPLSHFTSFLFFLLPGLVGLASISRIARAERGRKREERSADRVDKLLEGLRARENNRETLECSSVPPHFRSPRYRFIKVTMRYTRDDRHSVHPIALIELIKETLSIPRFHSVPLASTRFVR